MEMRPFNGGTRTVIRLMRTKLGWYQRCLYNQEIAETRNFP